VAAVELEDAVVREGSGAEAARSAAIAQTHAARGDGEGPAMGRVVAREVDGAGSGFLDRSGAAPRAGRNVDVSRVLQVEDVGAVPRDAGGDRGRAGTAAAAEDEAARSVHHDVAGQAQGAGVPGDEKAGRVV